MSYGVSANYVVLNRDDLTRTVLIRDIGPWTRYKSVTNDVESVVESLGIPDGWRLLCYDSNGDLDEILVKNGQFVGFAPGQGA